MLTRSRWIALALGLSTVIVLATATTQAQEPAQGKSTATPAKKKYDPSRRVPPYFGQIALSVEQRESIYKIRKSHIEKIDGLKKEIEKAESQMMVESEAVLTDVQKKLLENLRRSGLNAPKASEPTEKSSAVPKK